MARKKTIDELANEILRDFDAGDTPANRARAALQQARDAGDGGLRQEHLQQAQRHIASIDPARNHKTVQKLQAEVLALQGRGGDRHIAHVTPGEMVIPRSLLTPELMGMLAAVARQHGVDPREFFVGSGRNAVNPHTGQMEFDDSASPVTQPQDDIETVTVTGQRGPDFSDDDVNSLAHLMFAADSTNSTPGLYPALGSVAVNRIGNPKFTGNDTLQQVISKPGEFYEYNSPQWRKAEAGNIPDPVEKNAFSDAQRVARGLLSGEIGDPTGGATFFYSNNIDPSAREHVYDWRESAPRGDWRHLDRAGPNNGVLGNFTFLKQPILTRKP